MKQTELARILNRKTGRCSSWDVSGRNGDAWNIPAHSSRVLADIQGPGVITHIWMTQRRNYRNAVLKITWDDAPAPSVLCPLGDFFGLGHAIVNSYQSQLFTASTNGNNLKEDAPDLPNPWATGCALNCYAPMPFRKRAVVELLNESDADHGQYFYIDYEQMPEAELAGLGYFHAEFRRACPFLGWAPDIAVNTPPVNIPSLEREAWANNYVILETKGRGHYLGCNLSVTNIQGTWWGEGDDMIWVDGYKWPPDLHGTGSEDYLNQAWGMQPNAFLRNGSSIHESNTGGYQTSYVHHLENPVRFEQEIKVTIEHGHANHLGNEMASVAYWYAETPAAAIAIPPVEKRRRVPKVDGKFVIPEGLRWPGHEVKVDAAFVKEAQAAQESTSMKPLDDLLVEIGTRLELFVDDHLVERMTGVAFRLHEPVRQAPAKSPLSGGAYGTIIKDGDLYRAYYRSDIPGYEIGRQVRNADNEPNEITCYAESRDGIEWTFPDLGITKIQSSKGGNVILARQVPFTHNFSPFLDTRPGVGPDARYKALAGSGGTGLVAFKSADGIHWSKIQDAPVIKTPSAPAGTPWPFDGSSPAFWSEAENCYVVFVRTWGKTEPPQTDPDKKFQRRVSRATSTDFINWTPLADTGANLPGEQLYTNQTFSYFRAPHIYIAPMMRFTQGIEMGEPVEGNNGSSDIVLMTMRAGTAAYQRTFREAFIRPGLDPQRWERKANHMRTNVVPTGPGEMSLYHANGDRYTLRTDGFISVNAGADGGELRTKPLIFAGDALSVNFSTGAAGLLRVEIQDASGQVMPGFGLEDCQAVIGDAIERQVRWKNNPDLAAIAGKPVRLRFAMRECDVYSFRFRSK